MKLVDLIRGHVSGNAAPARTATTATEGPQGGEVVASVATVAVAAAPKPVPESPATVLADTAMVTSRWWLVHYADRNPVEVACDPEATHAEILDSYPTAIAAEPFNPSPRRPSTPMTAKEEMAVREWMELIGETDQTLIAAAMNQCKQDADARDYFIGRAMAEVQKSGPFGDDRRTCSQCANLVARRCQAAKRGEIVASRDFEPIRDLYRRCEGFAPGADDPDRRNGGERWPGLVPKGDQ